MNADSFNVDNFNPDDCFGEYEYEYVPDEVQETFDHMRRDPKYRLFVKRLVKREEEAGIPPCRVCINAIDLWNAHVKKMRQAHAQDMRRLHSRRG